MITRFQALVARESLADCYGPDGQSITIVKIRDGDGIRAGVWLVLAEYPDGSRQYLLPERVTPSNTVSALISNGTYNEATMQHKGYEGMITKLSY